MQAKRDEPGWESEGRVMSRIGARGKRDKQAERCREKEMSQAEKVKK